MIEVEQLTKQYGQSRGIQDVSFRVAQGEVVGFLGPNGAGKSTTMRILCGCIGATSGRAMVGGHDVLENPSAVKRRIGYLPEVPPLYGNMVVSDYVAFAARIKGVDDVEGATARAIDRVGLGGAKGRIIDHLSKGYRQRVGLAQALVHDPEVLVLDEPTSGLDPAQRVEIRELLRELAAGDRTVILSTHVLSEIEAICKRVVIINEGRVVAQDTIQNLAAAASRTRLRVGRPGPEVEARLRAVDGVEAVEALDGGLYRVTGPAELREHVAAAAVGFGLLELGSEDRLEDIYLRLTSGKAT
jgi:ABC-2 type transport system ATP-binding protein